MSNLAGVKSDNAARGQQFIAEPDILSVRVQSDNEEEGRTDNYIISTVKGDSNVVINKNSMVDTEEKNKLQNGGINAELTAKHLEFPKNIRGSSNVATSTLNTNEMFQELHDRKNDVPVTEKFEMVTVKLEKDEVLGINEENIWNEEERSNGCKIVTVNEVSNVVGGAITEETSSLYEKDLFRRYEFTSNNENYFNSVYLCDSYYDAASSSDAPTNTNIVEHKVFSIKNENVNHEEEGINYCSSSPLKDNDGYIVSRNQINDTDQDSIVKVKHELETFKTEDEEFLHEKKFKGYTVNLGVPIKKCFVNLERLKKAVGRNVIKNKRARTNEESLRCKICDFIAGTKLSLLEHDQTHKGKNGYCCNVCEYSTPYRQCLIAHLSKHTGNKPFCCSTCDYKTARKEQLIEHSRFHTGDKPFRCSTCDYKAARKGHMVEHLRIHTGEKPFRCNICDYTAARKSNLANHVRLHTGEKPFRCNVCDYSTTIKNTLVKHLRTHNGEKPFHCNVCEFSTTRRFHLTEHMHTHTGEKPFRCDVCEFSTAHRSNLSEHLHTHTSEKRFRCNSCDFKATRRGNLIKHMQKHSTKDSSKKSTEKDNVKKPIV